MIDARRNVAGVALLVFALTGCASAPGNPAPSDSSSATTTPSLTDEQGQEICTVRDGGGTYFADVTSRTAGDLSACDGGTRFTGTLDTILALPGADRRCIISPPTPYEALVGIYSDGKKADREAAQERCVRDGGSNE